MNIIILLININNYRRYHGAEDVVLDDRNGSFQNQRKLQLASEAPGALHEEIAQLELLNTSRQRKEGRRKLCDFLVLPLIGSEKNHFDRPKQRPRHRPQP